MATLSKNVLSMKFMQRTKERIEEKNEVECLFGKTAAKDSKDKPEITVWQTEESHVPCEGLLFGRMSFRGCNPDIERLMAEKTGVKHLTPTDPDESVDVTVEQMANIRTANKSNGCESLDQRSGQHKRKRNQYIAPVDD